MDHASQQSEDSKSLSSASISTATVPPTVHEGTGQERSEDKALNDALGGIPLGKLLVYIKSKWGWQGVILFSMGFLVAIALTFWGWLPKSFVSTEYNQVDRGAAGVQFVQRQKLSGMLLINDVNTGTLAKLDWLGLIVDLMGREGEDLKTDLPGVKIGAEAVVHEVQSPTTNFTWRLSVKTNYQMRNGRAFRVTKSGLIQQLNYELRKDDNVIDVSVPECDAGDRLLAPLLVIWTHNLRIDDLSSVVESGVR